MTTFLYDLAGRKFLEIEKVVEVTRNCPRVCGEGVQRKCFFLYATAEAGRIVRVSFHMEEGRSTSAFFYINKKLEEQIFFGFWAKKLGLTEKEFRALIEAHAPN